jgi:alkanesulfonate monooxygenase SsuD/methylene tetrahydromethanopterin reductase-like flavin-dependent oxidoreductase (luciferase family)
VLATLRDKILDLAIEIGDGAVWANASLSAIAKQAARIPADRIANGFHMGNMLPIVVLPENPSDEQIAGAADIHRKTLNMYVRLPNYRNYWHDNGYADEMDGIAQALERKDRDAIPALMTDRWLADCTLTGTASQIREGVEAWMAAGISTPILVPSSLVGGQYAAIDELLAVYGA